MNLWIKKSVVFRVRVRVMVRVIIFGVTLGESVRVGGDKVRVRFRVGIVKGEALWLGLGLGIG